MKIFVDMDEVVADWTAAVFAATGHNPENGWLSDELWAKFRMNPRLFRDLPVKPGATELMEYLKTYCTRTGTEIAFLTAIPHENDVPMVYYDKVMWATKHFPGVPVLFGPHSYDKMFHCTSPDDILIDDRRSNIQEWESVGGRGHIYTHWEPCKQWLVSQGVTV